MGTLHDRGAARRLLTGLLLGCGFVAAGVLAAAPAWAHGAGETEEGYLLVQQALGHLAHDTSMTGIDLATEKVNDALATKDQEGVNVAEVKQAKAALDAGNAAQGQALLLDSITGAMSTLMPAVGEETGTKVLLRAEPGRGSLGFGGWVAIGGSTVLALLGLAAAWRFRPQDNVRHLRRTLLAAAVEQRLAPTGTHAKDAS